MRRLYRHARWHNSASSSPSAMRFRCIVVSLALIITVAVLHWLLPHYVLARKVRNLQMLNERLHKEIAKLQKSEVGGSTPGENVRGETYGLPQHWNSAKSSRCDTIHVGFVAAGYNASRQVATVIKTILFYRHNPLHFHFVSDRPARYILSVLMNTWHLPAVNFSFYDAESLARNVSWIPTFHYSGVYGLMKLSIPDALPLSIEHIIMFDTDIMLNTDIALLWHFFEVITKEKKLLGIVENQSNWYLGKLWEHHNPWPALGRGFNTGVVLFNLQEMRRRRWHQLWSTVARKHSSPTALADQDVVNAVLKEYPQIHFVLPCAWNVQLSDNTLSEFCYQDAENFKIIHWNSPQKMDVENNHGAYFRTMYESFLEYNGNLLRHELITCHLMQSAGNDKGMAVHKSSESRNPCHVFRKEANLKCRTHPFFLGKNFTSSSAVTLFSQLSMDRLQMLEPLCQHWRGPMSISVYASDVDVIKLTNYFSSYTCFRHRNNIAIHVVYTDGRLYPVNYLRNVALEHVVTKYAFLLDIDFLPMVDLYDYLVEAVRVLGATKRAFIVPAFETYFYRPEFPQNKSILLNMLEKQSIRPFRYHEWANGHAPTNYEHWKTASVPYRIKWALDFEPYVVLQRPFPAYDTRFVGFGWNKVSHIMELHHAGYEFVVLPDAFIIHLPHTPSLDISQFRSSALYRDCLQVLKKEFQEELHKKYGGTV